MIRQKLRQGRFAGFDGFRQDHLTHRVDAVTLEEHVLGTRQAHSLGAESHGVRHLIRRVRVRADLQLAKAIGHLHQGIELLERPAVLALERFAHEHLDHFRGRRLDLTGKDLAAGAVD